MYDYLIVGTGLYGSICAYELSKMGYKVLVIDKREHIGGNIYTENIEGINVHKYGAHIFHTSNKMVWDYINQFAEFNNYINSPVARYKNEIYNLPFNMNTFSKIWNDVFTPAEAMKKIDEEKKKYYEQAINLVGPTIYEKLVKGYTAKQWGRKCNELPAFIIKRLPVRFTYDNNYFNDRYQGIPIGGYTKIIEKMLSGIEVKLNSNYFSDRKYYESISKNIIYTGPIDEFFAYKYGELEYRSVYFETTVLDEVNHQGNAVVNYTDYETPYTRIIDITLKDRIEDRAARMADALTDCLYGFNVTGPYVPSTGRSAEGYIRAVRISLPKDRTLADRKRLLLKSLDAFETRQRYTGHITVNVDPA